MTNTIDLNLFFYSNFLDTEKRKFYIFNLSCPLKAYRNV